MTVWGKACAAFVLLMSGMGAAHEAGLRKNLLSLETTRTRHVGDDPNVEAYPKWQAWMREKQPRLLVLWGKHDLSFDLSEPEAYRRDVPSAQVHVLDAGHFALDTAADEIADLVAAFVSPAAPTTRK